MIQTIGWVFNCFEYIYLYRYDTELAQKYRDRGAFIFKVRGSKNVIINIRWQDEYYWISSVIFPEGGKQNGGRRWHLYYMWHDNRQKISVYKICYCVFAWSECGTRPLNLAKTFADK